MVPSGRVPFSALWKGILSDIKHDKRKLARYITMYETRKRICKNNPPLLKEVEEALEWLNWLKKESVKVYGS